MKTAILNAIAVNEGQTKKADILIENDKIASICPCGSLDGKADKEIDATDCYLLPGVIDEHVHFREPGLTRKADISTESAAAAAGGVTTYFDMPNTVPATTSPEAWEAKMETAQAKSIVNYAFFYGATNSNAGTFADLDLSRTPGIKLFMGASTGGMLVDNNEALKEIFQKSPLPIMAHCEDSAIINANTERIQRRWGKDAPIRMHPEVRSETCCVESAKKAIRLATETGARLHIAHISTATELDLIARAGTRITGEACLAHLLFCDSDYPRMGARIKCNPAVKTRHDRDALRRALTDGRIQTVATDHAPHLACEKEGGCFTAASGMPMIQFSLPAMLTLSDEGILPIEQVVELMCHAPARLFGVTDRGYIRTGYKADLVLVKRKRHTVTAADVISKCGWSPLEGLTLNWSVETTLCNGNTAYSHNKVFADTRGEAVTFSHHG